MFGGDFFGFDPEAVKTWGIVLYTVFTGVIMALIAWQSFRLNKQVKILEFQSKPKFYPDKIGNPHCFKGNPFNVHSYDSYRFLIRNFGASISHVEIEGIDCELLPPDKYGFGSWEKNKAYEIIIDAKGKKVPNEKVITPFRVKISYLDAVSFSDKEKVVIGGDL